MSTHNLEKAFAAGKKGKKRGRKPPKKRENDLTPFYERFTEGKIEEWKKQFKGRELIFIRVEHFLAVLRPPTVEDIANYLTLVAGENMSKAVSALLQDLWLDGDYDLIEDEDNFIAVFFQINTLMEGKKRNFFALSERGKKDYEEEKTGLEELIVFGSMRFGANALKEWGEDLFFYRTGIALKIWEKQKSFLE